MLCLIRDKLKTWVVIVLVFLVSIPLVFLGVGDYGTNQEQYALKVNEQEISKSVVLQEMGQFKDVLRKNYQGSIPPIYTDQFIKKITFDNLIRRSVENNMSSSVGLVLSDESIVDDIKNTSSFRDEDGFNSQLYKRRLYMINMNPDVYEQYIYQKGIRDQLRKTIISSSFLSTIDKKININGTSMVKVTIQPGWNWKEHMSDIAGTEWCENRPVGIVVSGKYHAKHNDGTEFDILPGQAYVVEPGHNLWVVGDEPVVAYEFYQDSD